MALIVILLWDGFLLIGEGLGLQQRAARRFADVTWCLSVTLFAIWFVAILDVAVRR